MTYHSPHKFRHGFAVYALKRARDVPALKAVSQNLMHQNLTITDGVYGILSETDVRVQIARLGDESLSDKTQEVGELILLTKRLIVELQYKKHNAI